MTEKEKEAWNNIPEKERKKAEAKFEKWKDELISWRIDQEEKAVQKIKSEGKWRGGLDGSYPEMDEIKTEYQRRFQELLNAIQEFKENHLKK